jgi:pectate lyase
LEIQWKGSLVGHSDSNASEDRGHLRVTYHHNSFININSRTPSLRFGTAHIYSSCFTNIPTSGVNSRMGAQALVEHSYFSNVNKAIVTNLDSDQDGYALERNNIFSGSTIEITQTGNLSPPYSYTLVFPSPCYPSGPVLLTHWHSTDPASSVCDIISRSGGVGIVA